MGDWYQRLAADHHRLPMLACFAAFLVTWFVTRAITRAIRAGRGPFRNNVTASGVHIHHAVPGIIVLLIGAVASLATSHRLWLSLAGLLIGAGAALVLDEFALIVHLSDVYWSEEGRLSVQIVALTGACMGFVLVGLNPFDFTGDRGDRITLVGVIVGIVIDVGALVVCLYKGKPEQAVLGVFVPFLAIIGAVRLARPDSRWARRRYDEARLERARARERREQRRDGWLADLVGGVVDPPRASTAGPGVPAPQPSTTPVAPR